MTEQSTAIFDAILSTSHLLCREWRIYDQLFSQKDTHDFLAQTAKEFFGIADEAIYRMVQLRLCTLSDPEESRVAGSCYKNISLESLLAEIKNLVQDYEKIEKLVKKFRMSCKPIREVRNKLIAHADLDHHYKSPYYVSRKRIRVCVKRLENVMKEIACQRDTTLIYDDPLRGDGNHLLKILRKQTTLEYPDDSSNIV